jgi:hypothetical protein
MTNPTTPDDFPRWEISDPTSLVQVSQAIGDAVQTALNKHQRFDFVWANDTERNAQLGMVQGSRGYQIDVETEWLYDIQSWVLATAHAEWTFSTSIPNDTVTNIGTMTFDSTMSTSSSMTTTSTNGGTGQIVIMNPGLYAYTYTRGNGTAAAGRAFLETYLDQDIIMRHNLITGEDITTLVIPNLRCVDVQVPIYNKFYHTNGGSLAISGRITVTRIG